MDAGDPLLGAVLVARRGARRAVANHYHKMECFRCVVRRASQGVRRAAGGRPSSSVCPICATRVRPQVLTGQRQFVWWRQAAEHSLNGPVGGYPLPSAKPAAWFSSAERTVGLLVCALWAEGWGVGASLRVGTGNRCPPASERASRLGRLPAHCESLVGTAFTDPS
jgi:hypothetical protein